MGREVGRDERDEDAHRVGPQHGVGGEDQFAVQGQAEGPEQGPQAGGDAVAGRNIHAAIYDALRLCKDI